MKFELNFDKYGPLLTNCLIKNIWEYAYKHKIRIVEQVTSRPFLQRENDLYLMEVFAEQGYSSSELKKINRCRLHTQAMTLSDILDGYGNKYDRQAFDCIRSDYKSNPYLWPRQNRPGTHIRRLWRKAIRTCFPRDRYNQTEYSLGRWICDTDIDYWTWFFFPDQNLLYKKSMEGWEVFVRRTRAGQIGEYPLFQYQPYELALSTKLVDVISKHNLEVLHVHYAIPHASAAFMAKQILKTHGISIPYVTTLHGTDITLVGRDPSFEPVITFCINESDAVTAVSESLKEDTLKHFNVQNEITVVPNFILCHEITNHSS